MPKPYQNLLQKLEEELNLINLEEDDILKKSERSFQITLNTIEALKQKVISSGFKNQEEEIFFFKEIKPQFVSKLIYHISVFNIESNKPNGRAEIKKKYYCNEQEKLKKYFDNNLEFYRYYRTHSTYLDHKYFVRGKQDIRLTLDSFFFESDPAFSTSHDFKISRILANDLLNVYLEDELVKLELKTINNGQLTLEPKMKLKWTESKVSLIELMYALQSKGVFNNGNTGLKEIAAAFENIFDTDLGQYHRTFLEIRIRKTGRTKFLDTLTEHLMQRMDDADER